MMRWQYLVVLTLAATSARLTPQISLQEGRQCPDWQQCGSSCCGLTQFCLPRKQKCVEIPAFRGFGDCNKPEVIADDFNGKIVSVSCHGPVLNMTAGEASAYNQVVLLADPYPEDTNVAVMRMTSQMVDVTGRPVPLDELYVHHTVASPHFLLGEGSEIRGSALRTTLPEPYAYIINGRNASQDYLRYTNVQLISTAGVPTSALQRCIECWCDPKEPVTDPLLLYSDNTHTRGSLVCCRQCPSWIPANVTFQYRLQHNVTYRVLSSEQEAQLRPTSTLGFDVTGGDIEYDVLEPNAPNNTHVLEREVAIDYRCPQDARFTLLRCTAHQHVGGQCIIVTDANSGEELCRSCPKLGTEPGVAGNERGFVVAMLDDDLWDEGRTPPQLQPGTKIRITSKYDASHKRLGVMGLLTLWLGDLTQPCPGDFDFHKNPAGGGDYNDNDEPADSDEVLTAMKKMAGMSMV